MLCLCINSFSKAKNGVFARTRYDDLLHFFSEYENPRAKDLELFEAQSRKIVIVLDQLWKCFGSSAKALRNRSYVLSIYLYVEELLDGDSQLSAEDQRKIAPFFAKLWKSLKDEMKLGMERKNKEIYVFQNLLSSAPGEEYQIRRRHEKLDEFYKHFKRTGAIKGDQPQSSTPRESRRRRRGARADHV